MYSKKIVSIDTNYIYNYRNFIKAIDSSSILIQNVF